MVGGKAMVVAVQAVLECWRKGMGSWNLKRDVATAETLPEIEPFGNGAWELQFL